LAGDLGILSNWILNLFFSSKYFYKSWMFK
jgi:hypothetical protein